MMYKTTGTVCSDSQTKRHNCNVISMQSFWILNLVVCIVIGRLRKVNGRNLNINLVNKQHNSQYAILPFTCTHCKRACRCSLCEKRSVTKQMSAEIYRKLDGRAGV
jgi:hypothetical protein